jgi:hypothetical protein
MKIIVLKGNGIISEFTDVIFYELKQKYEEIEYKDRYDPKDKDILHFLISPQKDVIPHRFILYNLEPLNFRVRHRKDYMEKIKKAEQVWEYSKTNLQLLKQFNENIIYQPFLYSPIMESIYNIQSDHPKDIDILFYGLMSSRRIKIINDLKKANINVYCPNYPIHKPVWGKDKFNLINRAKIVINIHYHTDPKDQTNDLLRIMFLLANKVPVIQEETLDKDLDNQLKDIIVPYNGIVNRCKEMLKKSSEELKQFSEKIYNFVKTEMKFKIM